MITYFVLFGCWSVTTSSRSYFAWSGYCLPSLATNFSLLCSLRGDLTLGFLGGGSGVFLPCLTVGSYFVLAGETDFDGDIDSFFFVFLDTTSFHSPSGEWSVVVSTVEWVLGPSDDAMECWGVDGVEHTATLSSSSIFRVDAAIFFSAILSAIFVTPPVTPSAGCFAVLLYWLVFRDVWVLGSCQVISNLTICFPSVKRQMGRPTIGRLLSAKAHTWGTSMVSIVCSSQLLLWDWGVAWGDIFSTKTKCINLPIITRWIQCLLHVTQFSKYIS